MGGFLGELSKRFAERWMSLLVAPGVFYLSVIATAHVLGQSHAMDASRLVSSITRLAKAPAVTSTAGQAVLLTALLAGAAGTGMAAQALGAVVEHLTLAVGWRAWPSPLRCIANRLTRLRRQRWTAEHERYQQLKSQAEQAWHDAGQRENPASRYAAYRAWVRIGLEQPDRPTWSADRINAASIRLRRDLNINLTDIWPYLWLHVPDHVRTEISAARTELARASALAGWGVLYGLLTLWWWPALFAASILVLVARHRIRVSIEAYAQLVEAVARLHLASLASQLGPDGADLSLPALGAKITHQYLSSSPSPPFTIQTTPETGPSIK